MIDKLDAESGHAPLFHALLRDPVPRFDPIRPAILARWHEARRAAEPAKFADLETRRAGLEIARRTIAKAGPIVASVTRFDHRRIAHILASAEDAGTLAKGAWSLGVSPDELGHALRIVQAQRERRAP